MTTDLIKEAAIEYLKEGLSVIPTAKNKKATKEWKERQEKRLTEEEIEEAFFWAEAIGILAGEISGGLEVIDVDCKYDLTGLLWDQLKTALEGSLPESLDKYVICSTQSGGYHILYRCDKIQKSSKLALRQATREEKEKEPKENFKGLIETRGEGAYILAYPSPGYNFVQGTIKDIPRITPEERDIIWSVCKSFNEVQEAEKPLKRSKNQTIKNSNTKSPFDDYNERADAVGLLEDHGWNVVKKQGERIFLKRPSTDSSSEYSGNYHTRHNKLVVFSLNTEFEPGEAYSPADIYILLNCNGDTKEAYKKLLAEGYGEPYIPEQTEIKKEKMQLENIVIQDQSEEVIVSQGETLDLEIIEGDESLYIVCQGYDVLEEVKEAVELLRHKTKRIYIKPIGEEAPLNYGSYLAYSILNEVKGKDLKDEDLDHLALRVAIERTPLTAAQRLHYNDIIKENLSEISAIFSEEYLKTIEETNTRAISETLKGDKIEALLRGIDTLNSSEAKIKKLEEGIEEIKALPRRSEYEKLLEPKSYLQVIQEEKNKPESLETDFKINGKKFLLNGGELSIFAAASGHGKTAMIINTMLNCAILYPDKKFIYLTYEESENAILSYFLLTYINLKLSFNQENRRLIKEYFRTEDNSLIDEKRLPEFLKLKEEFFNNYIETGRILIKYTPEIYADELPAVVSFIQSKEPKLGAVFIDYFQLLSLSPEERKKRGSNSRQEELKEISKIIKYLAERTGLPFVLAAQFNRNLENLLDVHASNIREAADIEQIAGTILGLWNISKEASSISKTQKTTIESILKNRTKGMYVKLLKSRDLETGIYEILDYDGETGRIMNNANKGRSMSDF